MKTIEERADEFIGSLASSFLGFPDILEGGKNGYIQGATEQRDIDIKEFSDRLTEMQGEYITLELINGLINEMKDEK